MTNGKMIPLSKNIQLNNIKNSCSIVKQITNKNISVDLAFRRWTSLMRKQHRNNTYWSVASNHDQFFSWYLFRNFLLFGQIWTVSLLYSIMWSSSWLRRISIKKLKINFRKKKWNVTNYRNCLGSRSNISNFF